MFRRMLPLLIPVALPVVGCTGTDTDSDTDTGLPQGCELATNADTFSPVNPITVGDDIRLGVDFEAQCTESLTLTFSWREPRSDAFFLPGDLQDDPTLVLEPYTPVTVDVLFRPPSAGSFTDRLEAQSDNVRVGGVVLRFNGEGVE